MTTVSIDEKAVQLCLNDLKLPKLSFPIDMTDPGASLFASRGPTFEPEHLATALRRHCIPQAMESYIRSYPRSAVKAKVNSIVDGFRLLVYAVDANCLELVKLLLDYGAIIDSSDSSKIPLLARAIMQTKWTVQSSTEIVKALLAYGADPEVIPKDMWKDYIKQPAISVDLTDKTGTGGASWCKPGHRAVLVETLHLTHRYLLWRASLSESLSARRKQIASHHNLQLMFGLPFMVIGQHHACNLVMDHVFSEIAFSNGKPLVLAFAGPSGHGKTELARQLGSLINVPSLEIDCAQLSTEFGLLGPTIGYRSDGQGSELNNFLTANSGVRCVVFLDEFDKTSKEVRDALLKVTDTGMYLDRRPNGDKVDSSKCIWIMASNLGDGAIEQFHADYLAKMKDEDVIKVSIEPLRKQVQRVFRGSYSAAVTGRIDAVVPFFPFSPNEQAVVAHKFFQHVQKEARLPIDLEIIPPKYVGHCHINIKDDGPLCRNVVKEGYISKQGARSIGIAVDRVRREFFRKYSHADGKVTEVLNCGPLQKYSIELHPGAEGMDDEVAVYRDGVTSLK